MFRFFQLALLLLAPAALCADVVDRIVVVVNKQVILRSQLDQAARVECLLGAKPLSTLRPTALQAVLERMIDQALLEQQIISVSMVEPAPEDVAARIQELRSQIPGAESEEKWQAMLASYGLTLRDLEVQVLSQIRILRFIDLRFRTMARADRAAVNAYYQDKFVPELKKQGASVPPLSQVSDKIEEILTEQRIDDLLSAWLQTLRAQSLIQRLDPLTGVQP